MRTCEDLEGPAKANAIYLRCREKSDNKEMCARIAWQTYCRHVDPSYPGCTRYGKTAAMVGPRAESLAEEVVRWKMLHEGLVLVARYRRQVCGGR